MTSGLEGVVAAQTVLSHVDGEKGIIWVRGHSLDDLVANEGFEGTIALLWEGFAGNGLSRSSIVAELGAERMRAFENLGRWLPSTAASSLDEAVRVCLGILPEASKPAAIVAALPVGVAALLRARRGEAPVAPDPSLGTAADFLAMLNGTRAGEQLAKALDTYFTAVIDNGLGASTFAARVVASTKASLVSAVVAGYCAFTGPIHGGAPGEALAMLDEIAASGDVDAWVERKLAAGERLMGFGHRVFRVRDPRADVLRAALARVGSNVGRLAFAAEVERSALAALERHKPGRRLQSNLEINAALLLDAIGLPREAFTPVFAIGRVPGWLAHALEQQRTGRMIRPRSEYVGPQVATLS